MDNSYANGAGMQPGQPGQPTPESAETGPQGGESVTIAESADGTYLVNNKPAKTIDDALNMAREILTGDDGGMSVQQAFSKGFGAQGQGPGY